MFSTKAYVGGLMVVAALLIGANQSTAESVFCKRPDTRSHCNASESFVKDWKNTGWFFQPVLGVCLPYYTRNGWHVCTQNYNVPATREICEDVCAEPCIKTNLAPGICMHEDICTLVYTRKPNYTPCRGDNVNCCPKVPDKELQTAGGRVNAWGQFVATAFVRPLNEIGFGPDYCSYIFHLPRYPKNDSRHVDY